MFSTKTARGAMLIHTIRRYTRSGNGRYFTSVSTPPPPEGGNEGVGEKAKQTMENVLGAAKDTSQKVKDGVTETGTGTGTGTSKPSRNPELNHGAESTDSSCEDVRSRPGGYS